MNKLIYKMNLNIIPYKTVIKKIIHISDIHIHLYKRHDEYKIIFNNLYNKITEIKKKLKIKTDKNDNISLIVVITGDILHCKSDLSPECVNFTYKFLKSISSLVPLILIPGNHDVNMNNQDSMDSITPIIADLNEKYPIHYLNKTGIWSMSNLIFVHSSIYDYKIIDKEYAENLVNSQNYINNLSKTAQNNLRYIYLFHGRINGVEIFNGIKLTGEVDKETHKTITATAFDNYDMVLLGDVHRHYFIKDNMAYAGSLIQQNFGESIDNHGLIEWTVSNNKGLFYELKNDNGYFTFNISNNKISFDDTLFQGSKKELDNSIVDLNINNILENLELPKKLYLRVFYFKTKKSLVYDLFDGIDKKNYNIYQITYQECSKQRNEYILNNQINNDVDDLMRNEYLNINSVENQNKILEDILINDLDISDDEIITTINSINKNFNNLYLTDIDGTKNRSNNKNKNFKLLKLKFSNLFSYGGNNIIDFSTMKGIVGIIAPNHTGKSAILDIILYVLYDKFSRKGSIKDIINHKCNDYEVEIELKLGSWRYIINKSGCKSKSGKSTSNECKFYRNNILTGREERLELDTVKKTKSYITELFGEYEDSINTTFSIQTNTTGFIDSESSKRKAELERILHMDFIGILQKKANENYKDNKAVFEHLQKTMPPSEIINIQENIKGLKESLTEKILEQEFNFNSIKKINSEINDLNMKYDTTVDNKINEIMNNNNIEDNNDKSLTENLDKSIIKKRYDELKKDKTEITNNIKEYILKFQKYIKKIDIETDIDKIKINNSDNYDNLVNSNIITKIKEYVNDEKYFNLIKGAQNEKYVLIGSKTNFNSKIKIVNNNMDSLIIKIKSMFKELNNLIKLDIFKNIKIDSNIEELRVTLNKIVTIINDLLNDYDKKLFDNYEINLEKYNNKLDLLNEKINSKEKEINKLSLPPNLESEITNYKEKQENLLLNIKSLLTISTIKQILNKTTTDDDLMVNMEDLIKNIKDLGFLEGLFNKSKKSDEYKELNKKIKKYKEKKNNVKEQLLSFKNKNKIYKLFIIFKQLHDLFIEYDNEYTNLKTELKNINNKIEKIDREHLIINKITNYTDLIFKNTTEMAHIKLKIAKLNLLEPELDDLIEKMKYNKQIKEQIKNKTLELSKLSEVQERLLLEIEKLKEQINKFNGQIDTMKRNNKDKKEKEQLMIIYKHYADALKILPFKLLKNIELILEHKINDFLISASTNFTIKINISDSKIEMFLCRKQFSKSKTIINNCSGFERFITSLAVRLALLEITQLPYINMLAIDEGWSCFDKENIANLDIIFNYLCQKFDFLLIISHMDTIKQHCDEHIMLSINSETNMSKVKYFNKK